MDIGKVKKNTDKNRAFYFGWKNLLNVNNRFGFTTYFSEFLIRFPISYCYIVVVEMQVLCHFMIFSKMN